MKKKLLSVVLASAMLTGTLAGCGSGQSHQYLQFQ